jgi:hypothetical protein
MPFEVKEEEPLTERIGVRLTAAERCSCGQMLTTRACRERAGQAQVFRPQDRGPRDEKMIRHLNRIGGLLKHVHNQSGGIYAAETARALAAGLAYIDQFANKGLTNDPQVDPGRSGQGRAQVQGDQHR